MNKTVPILLAGLFWLQAGECQLSFKEKRLRDKAYYEGIELILMSEYEMASATLTGCLEIDSTFAPAYLQRGRILIEWGALSEAENDLDSAIAFDPGLGEAYFYKGYLHYGRDTTGMDALLFDRAISSGFNDPFAYYFRGLTRIRDGKDGMALSDFNEAVRLKTDFALAYHERAGVKRRMGDLQGAHFDYRTALEYSPDFALAYNNLGSVKILLGDYEGAAEEYSHALQLDPGMGMALNNRGYAYFFLGDREKALSDFDAALQLEAEFPEASVNKSTLLAGEEQIEPALELLGDAIEQNPGAAVLYLNRGLIREMMGDLKGACEDWDRALSLGAAEAETYLIDCDE